MTNQSYVIVGAGVFGVSTAYELIKKYPKASITIVDRDAYDAETRCAASWDWNKVVRADYDDLVYCRMTIEAQDIFKNDPLWKPYFHETGIYWLCRGDYAQAVINNYKTLGRKAELQALSVAEAKKLYGGMFSDADYEGVTEVLVNKTSGWGAAGDCLRAVTKRSLELGVKYVVAEVGGLAIEKGKCVGVKTTKGVVRGDKVILATGAYTGKLLEMAARQEKNLALSAGDRIIAAGIATGMHVVDQKSYDEKWSKMPVGMQGYPASIGPFLGSLPPTPNRELKWWGTTIFKNTQELYPQRFVSVPPDAKEYAQWDFSDRMKEDIARARNSFYGEKSRDWKMEKHRVCWDAFTTSSDFIISPHAACDGLYLATCGNFHGWKFFPVLGKYVVQMLEGSLEKDLVQKWAWDRERPDASQNPEFPRAEMYNLLDKSLRARL